MAVASIGVFWTDSLGTPAYLPATGFHPKSGQGEAANFSDPEYF